MAFSWRVKFCVLNSNCSVSSLGAKKKRMKKYGIKSLPKVQTANEGFQTLKILFQDCKMFLNLWKNYFETLKSDLNLLKNLVYLWSMCCISEEIMPRHCTVFHPLIVRVSTSSQTRFQNMLFGTFLPAFYFVFHVWNLVNSWLIIKGLKPCKLFSISENLFCETQPWFWNSNTSSESLKKSLVSEEILPRQCKDSLKHLCSDLLHWVCLNCPGQRGLLRSIRAFLQTFFFFFLQASTWKASETQILLAVFFLGGGASTEKGVESWVTGPPPPA